MSTPLPFSIPTLKELKSELIREQVQLEEDPKRNRKRLEHIYMKIRRCNSALRKLIGSISPRE